MTATYMGQEYAICRVNFPERLLGLHDYATFAADDMLWVRAENADIHKPNARNLPRDT